MHRIHKTLRFFLNMEDILTEDGKWFRSCGFYRKASASTKNVYLLLMENVWPDICIGLVCTFLLHDHSLFEQRMVLTGDLPHRQDVEMVWGHTGQGPG